MDLDKKKISVWVDETRPYLQGARLTAWELQQAGIDVTVICDNMAGTLMKQGKIGAVITGADRESFQRLVEMLLAEEHIPVTASSKSRSKRTRWV